MVRKVTDLRMDNARLFGRDAYNADRVSHASYTTSCTFSTDIPCYQIYAETVHQKSCVIRGCRVHEPLSRPRESSSV